ncbi:MAG: DUF4349 domain-containing protein [Thermosediminibacteraceae bacterium]|nr:DUF4349 domain-containing protein [Thermosediminibacteraceae bacterium]
MVVNNAEMQANQGDSKNVAGITERKIVKYGTLHLEVSDLKKTETQIYNLIQEYGGFIQSSSTRNENREV